MIPVSIKHHFSCPELSHLTTSLTIQNVLIQTVKQNEVCGGKARMVFLLLKITEAILMQRLLCKLNADTIHRMHFLTAIKQLSYFSFSI